MSNYCLGTKTKAEQLIHMFKHKGSCNSIICNSCALTDNNFECIPLVKFKGHPPNMYEQEKFDLVKQMLEEFSLEELLEI